MTTAAKTNFGGQVWMGPSGGSLTMIAELKTFDPPVPEREVIEATTHDSAAGAKEFVAEGVFDPGELTFQINYIANSAGDVSLAAAIGDGVKRDFRLVAKAASGSSQKTFSGFVTKYGQDPVPTSGLQTASVTVKVTGAIAQS